MSNGSRRFSISLSGSHAGRGSATPTRPAWRHVAISALTLGCALAGACDRKPSIGLEVEVPAGLTANAAWVEVAAFRGASCGPLAALLPSGIPNGYTSRVAFPPSAPLVFGDLPNARYAFTAAVRGEDCAVLAAGCSEVDTDDVDTVTIPTTSIDPALGACPANAACRAGQCVPQPDNQSPGIGAGCSLELVGTGPLDAPVAGAGTLVSAPAVSATKDGFLVVYREVDPNGAGARLTLFPIDGGGGAGTALRPGLPNRCATSDETDGIGLVVGNSDALITLAKAPCADNPSLELVRFGLPLDPAAIPDYIVSPAPAGVRVNLGAARASARSERGARVVFTEAGAARIANVDPERGVVGPNGTFGAAGGNTAAWMAENDETLALLASGRAGEAADGGATDAAASGEPTLRLLMLPATTANDQIDAALAKPRAPITFGGEWGSIAATGPRVVVLSSANSPTRSAAFRTFDRDGTAPVLEDGFALDGVASAATGDVTIEGDRVFFAALHAGGIELHAYDGVTKTPRPIARSVLARVPRIMSLANVRADGRVAVAATRTRVAVVWTTGKVLRPDDPSGGYAVFACTQ